MNQLIEQIHAKVITAWQASIWLSLMSITATAFGVLSYVAPGSYVPFIILVLVLVATKHWRYAALPIGIFGLLAVAMAVLQLFGSEAESVRPLLLLMLTIIVALGRRFLPILIGAAGIVVITMVLLAVVGLLTLFPAINSSVLYLALLLFALAAVWKARKPLQKLNQELGDAAAKEQVEKAKAYLRQQWPGAILAGIGFAGLIYDRLVWSSAGFRLQEPILFGQPVHPDQFVYGAALVAVALVFLFWMPDDVAKAASQGQEPETEEQPMAEDAETFLSRLYELDKRERIYREDWTEFLAKTLQKLKITQEQLDHAGVTPERYSEYAAQRAIIELRKGNVITQKGTVHPTKLERLGFRPDFLDKYQHHITPEELKP